MKRAIFILGWCGVLLGAWTRTEAAEPEMHTIAAEKIWIPSAPAPVAYQHLHELRVVIRNTLSTRQIFTSFETFRPYLIGSDGKKIIFSDWGRDHWAWPRAEDFITLATGDTGTLRTEIGLFISAQGEFLSYENPTGDVYTYKIRPGIYLIGMHHEIPPDFFDGFNDPKRESYHQPWDKAGLIWRGTADSEPVRIEIR